MQVWAEKYYQLLEKGIKSRNPYKFYECCNVFLSRKANTTAGHTIANTLTWTDFKSKYNIMNAYGLAEAFINHILKEGSIIPTVNTFHRSISDLNEELKVKENTISELTNQVKAM